MATVIFTRSGLALVLCVAAGCGGGSQGSASGDDASPYDARSADSTTTDAGSDGALDADGETPGPDSPLMADEGNVAPDAGADGESGVECVDATAPVDPSCGEMPRGGFTAGTEHCYLPPTPATGSICIPDTLGSGYAWRDVVAACAPLVGEICPAEYTRTGNSCCVALAADRPCPSAQTLCVADVDAADFAYGMLLDTDGDQIPDLFDNCPTVPNSFQQDADGDGLGDVCDDCPFTFDPSQLDTTDAGVGNACNCGLPGHLALGHDGCPCTADGGLSADASPDSGDVCGLVVISDGGIMAEDR